MTIRARIRSLSDPTEPVEVELSLEGCQLVFISISMNETNRQYKVGLQLKRRKKPNTHTPCVRNINFSHLGMPEVQWQDFAHEFVVIPNNESVTPRQPADNVRLLLLEHAHELAGERVGMAPFTS